MEILLCRHGETATNTQGKTHLRNDEVGLNDAGRLQASRLTAVAGKHKVKALFASPEKRAIETAQIAGQPLRLELQVIDDLRERDWGDWSGEPWSNIEAKLRPMTLEERYTFAPPNGESWQQMEQRLKHAVDKIAQTVSGNVMIVTHGGALRALVPILKAEERIRSLGYNFDNTSVTLFSYSQGNYELGYANDTTHL